MALGALHPQLLLLDLPSGVLNLGHRFEMVRIDTAWLSAQVIQGQPVWYGSQGVDVGPAVCLPYKFAFPVPAISEPMGASGPKPACIRFVYL